MNQRTREPFDPTDEHSGVGSDLDRDDAHARGEPPRERPVAGQPAAARSEKPDNPPDSHTGYAEMDSRQRKRWDAASGELDPERAVWGTNQESEHVDDDARDDRPQVKSERRPDAATSKSRDTDSKP